MLFLDRAGHTFIILRVQVAWSALFLNLRQLLHPASTGASPTILLDDRHKVHLGLALLQIDAVDCVWLAGFLAHLLESFIEILVCYLETMRWSKRTSKVQSIWRLLVLRYDVVFGSKKHSLWSLLLVLPLDLLVQRVLRALVIQRCLDFWKRLNHYVGQATPLLVTCRIRVDRRFYLVGKVNDWGGFALSSLILHCSLTKIVQSVLELFHIEWLFARSLIDSKGTDSPILLFLRAPRQSFYIFWRLLDTLLVEQSFHLAERLLHISEAVYFAALWSLKGYKVV